MRILFALGVLLLGMTPLHSLDTIGNQPTHLGRQYISAAGVSIAIATPLANSFAAQAIAPIEERQLDLQTIAAVGEPCRRLHPEKGFETFSHIRFDRRDSTVAKDVSRIGQINDEVIAYNSNTILLENGTLDSMPVTNAEYKSFVDATNHPAPLHWDGGNIPEGKENSPVTHVSYDDAQAYAKWSEKRLPTDNEWMSAADQLSWDLEMPPQEWTAAPNAEERAMILDRRNGSFADVARDARNADTTFRLVSPL